MRWISRAAPPLMGRLLLCLAAALLLLARPVPANAHPMGNFTVNNYSRLEVGQARIDLYYVLDMAEVPAFQERSQIIDTDLDRVISAEEEEAYLAAKSEEILTLLHLEADGERVPLRVESRSLEFPEGEGGLFTLRLSMHLTAALPGEAATRVVNYRNYNDTRRLGWREIVARPVDAARLLDSTVPAEDVSNELRDYPADLLEQPLAASEASFRIAPGEAGASMPTDAPAAVPASPSGEETDGFTALLGRSDLGWSAILLALVGAFGWGAAHALTPGHGKAIVAAYLIGSRGTARHALFLGLTTTVTHTAGVFALGLLTLFLSRYLLPEQIYPWLEGASGLLVAAIGLSLLWQRLQGLRGASLPQGHAHPHPSTHAHVHEHHPHDHSHAHEHHHAHDHTHLPPGAHGEPVTWRSLLALGVSGGLLPCPSAVVVLLGAVALQRIGVGLLLIVAFSAGLASVLTGIGLLLIHARRYFERIPSSGSLFRVLPVGSALVITVLGLALTMRAAGQF